MHLDPLNMAAYRATLQAPEPATEARTEAVACVSARTAGQKSRILSVSCRCFVVPHIVVWGFCF